MPDHPVPQFRVSWQAKDDGPSDRYTRREHTAERMARWLKRRGIEAVWWPVTIWGELA